MKSNNLSNINQINEYRKLKNFILLKNKTILKYFKEYLNKKKNDNRNILCFFLNRLDIILFLSGCVKSIKESRQLITHNKILVNNNKVNLNFFKVNIKDIIEIKSITSVAREKNFDLYSKCPEWINKNLVNDYIKTISLKRIPNEVDSNLILKLNDILISDYLTKNYGIK